MDELITCGDTSISSANLRRTITKLHNTVSGKGITGYQEQFQVINQSIVSCISISV